MYRNRNTLTLFGWSLAVAIVATSSANHLSAQGQVTGDQFVGTRTPWINVGNVGIEEAVRIIHEHNGGTMYFPAGVYQVDGSEDTINVTQFSFNDIDGLTLTGDGDASVIRLRSDGSWNQTRPLSIFNCRNVTIRKLKFNGNRQAFQDNPEEQQNNILVRGCENLTIERVTTVNTRGDGMNLGDVNNVLVQNNYFDKNDRNAFTLGHGFHSNVLIRNNIFGKGTDTQHIDFEHGSSEYISIKNNTFRKMQPEDLVNKDQYSVVVLHSENVTISGNDMRNPVVMRFAKHVDFKNNSNCRQLTLDRICKFINVYNNNFAVGETYRKANQNVAAIRVREVQGLVPTDNIIKNNTVVCNGIPAGILVQDAKRTLVQGNTVIGGSGVQDGLHIHAQQTNVPITEFNNTISNVNNEIFVKETGGNNVIFQ